MLELKPRPTVGTSRARGSFETSQPRKLMLALSLLLVALIAVLFTDRQFWFGSNPLILDSDGTEQSATPKTSQPVQAAQSTPQPAPVAQKHLAPSTSSPSKAASAPTVTATRTVLPPLDVEVVAGSTHRTARPAINVVKPETSTSATAAPKQSTGNLAAANNAAERESIPSESEPTYPLLAQHMNVQGSVVLQAIIGADGIIEDIHVLAGPSILAAAAQQAVREWHFRPVLQNGQPVETKAKITVNFTINVADGSAKTTLAESHFDGIRILSR